MMVADHRAMLWPHHLSLMLGLWLITTPFTLGYLSDFAPDANQLRVMAERGLPSFEWRNLAMAWSDVVSGVLIVVFSALAANTDRRFPWAQWANAAVGTWLLFAPLVFWAPLAAAYTNATLVGALELLVQVRSRRHDMVNTCRKWGLLGLPRAMCTDKIATSSRQSLKVLTSYCEDLCFP